MKTLAWLFGIFFCVSSAYGQKTVTIEGDIRNMPDTVRFSYAACTSYIYLYYTGKLRSESRTRV
ncbi:hypothetical protein [uncultured Parabacteroides sp.]|uniref:hypothetical protein n=1 Tax=uncultured Parabacteroides sp. TaxID=512312 RepID=UPI00262475E4|nr:hypothetical protein [uncultured Parabacteroides sp.]